MNLRINLKKRLFLAAFVSLLSAQMWADQGYAVFDSENNTLTFYYGEPVGEENVDYYDIEIASGQYYPKWRVSSIYNNVTTIVFDDTFKAARPSSLLNWFYGFSKLTTIRGIENLNTSNVTTMGGMFYGCSGLTELDVTGFDTSKVTSMNAMFMSCSGMTELDVTNFDTSNVTNMSCMFADCSGLTELDVTGFDTSNVTDMSAMFMSCSGLTKLNVTGLNNSKVTRMHSIFSGCKSLTELDLTGFNTPKVTDMSFIFYNSSGLTELDLSNFDTSNVTTMESMFNGCKSLQELDVTSFNTSKVRNMSTMFQSCYNLRVLDITGFDTSNVTTMSTMFNGCGLTTLNLSNFNTSNVTHMNGMFSSTALQKLDLSSFDTSKVTEMSSMFYASRITSVTFGKEFMIQPTAKTKFMLYASRLRYIDFYASDDTDAITSVDLKDLSNMFYGVPATAVIYLPHGSQKVTDVDNVVYSYDGDENDLRCYSYYSEDKVDIELPRDFRVNIARYLRAISTDYGSVILPYDFTSDYRVQAYTLDEEHTKTMYFRNAENVPAHTPFVFKKLTGKTAYFTMTDDSFNYGITVYATRDTELEGPYEQNTNLSGWTAKGYYVRQIINDYDDGLYFIKNDKFCRASGQELVFPPHRVTFHGAWTNGDGNAKDFFDIETLGENEVITAIEAAEVRETTANAQAIYDTAGRRITSLQKGVNIVRMNNGTTKKIIIK